MDLLIWIGAAIAAAGLAGLVWCIFAVARARRARVSEERMRVLLRTSMTVNLAAFMTSVFGLIMVIVGVVLA